MSTGLLQQLADYGAFHDENQGYIDVADVFAAGNSVSPSDTSLYAVPRRSNRFGVWVAVAAVVLTVLLIGVIPLLFSNQETPPADTVVATTLAESAPTTLAESTPTTLGELVLIPGTWSQVPHDEAVFGGEGEQNMFGVTAGGPGLVAVGATGGWFGDGDAAVWTSVDGITWTRVAHDENVFGGANSQTMWDVTVGDFGLVAVGHDGHGILDDVPDVDAAIWTSVDGDSWSRVPHDEEVFGGAWITSVTVGGPGLVAVGGTDGYFTDGDAVVWTSTDGITWSRVPHDETIFGGPQRQTMYDVVAGGPGLVAVGREGDERPWDNSDDNAAAVWTSVDGITWNRVPHDETVFGTGGNPVMLSVTAGGPGLVAVGADYWPSERAETPVWTSPDGFTWTRVPDDESFRGSMNGVTAGGSGLVAVGAEGMVWTSADGITWSRVPNDDAVFGSDWVFRVTFGGPGFVAVGWDGSNAAVWVSEED
ncbi:MAG: hypothetical protein V3S32_11660 [Acidimicrobiia bacterium]